MAGVAITDKYILELLDKITAPLRNIEKHASKLNETMEKLQALAGSGAGLVKLAGIAGGAVAGFMVLKTVIAGVIGVLEKGAELAWEFGKAVIEATRFRVQNITTFEMFLGKGAGEKTFDKLLQIGNILPMDERDVVKQGASLASAGYKDKGLWAANAFLADIQALRGNQYRDNAELHLLRLRNEAKPEARDVKMLGIDTGLGMEGVMSQLFKFKGVKIPKDLFHMEELYAKMIKEGKVNGQDVAQAVMYGWQEKINKGRGLGSAAADLGEGTLSGLMTNLAAAPMRFMMQMHLEDMPGIQSLMIFIRKILAFFDHATPQGKQLAWVIRDLTNTLFGGLDKITSKDLGRFFEAGIEVAKRFIVLVEDAWKFVDRMLHDNGSMTAALGSVLLDVGKLIGTGIWQGFKAAMLGWDLKPQAPVKGLTYDSLGNTRGALGELPGRVAGGFSDALGKVGDVAGSAWDATSGTLGKVGGGFGQSFRKVGEALHLVSPEDRGAATADAYLNGMDKRIKERLNGPGGSSAPLEDATVELARNSAYRTGAAQ